MTAHREQLTDLLQTVLRLRAKEAYEIIASVLENLFISLSFLYTCEHEKERKLMDRPLDQYLAIRVSVKDSTMTWVGIRDILMVG